MKKLKISRLTPDSRYLQTVALNISEYKFPDINLATLPTQIESEIILPATVAILLT